MAKLTKYHLGYKMPEPEPPLEMYYKPDHGCQKFPQECYESDLEAYQEALDLYNFINNPVEPEWIKFEGREPDLLQWIYFKSKNGNMGYSARWQGNKGYKKTFYWCDKKSHDKKQEEWKQYQQLYEGWELVDDSKTAPMFKSDNSWILFTPNYVSGGINGFKFESESISLQLFDLICEENLT